MTALLDLHPDAGHPVVAAACAVHEVLDRLEGAEPLTSGEYAAVIGEWERAASRIAALKLRLVAAADRAEVALDAGMSGTSAWLARHTRSGGADAARDVRLAVALDESLPATSAALGRGELSPAHAAVIAQAARRLPAGLTAEQRERVEQRLVAQARRLDPVRLRHEARRALDVVEADQSRVDAHEDQVLRDEEASARARTRLTLHDNLDGTVTGHFTVPALAAAILRKTIHQLASPRRDRGTHRSSPALTPDWAARQGAALVELLEHLPTDHLHGKVAATVVITIDHRRLTAAVGAAGIDTGEQLSAGETRRLACQAGILPAVLDGEGQVLDLGRTKRFFTEAQRVALATHHSECAADGCDRPFAWTELHHATRWVDGGRTDLREAVPLCAFHHQRIHDPGYTHRIDPGGVSFHLRS